MLLLRPSLLWLFVFVTSFSSFSAQPSYDDGNYGYDDPNDESGYAPRPPPVVDSLYHDYAARQESKGGDGIGLGGGYVARSVTFLAMLWICRLSNSSFCSSL